MTLYVEHKNCGCRIAGTGESLERRLSIEYCQHHSAFDTLLADNARMRSEIVRSHTALHGEMSSVGSGECECEWCKETR